MMKFLSDHKALVVFCAGIGLIAVAVCLQNGVASASMFLGMVACLYSAFLAIGNSNKMPIE